MSRAWSGIPFLAGKSRLPPANKIRRRRFGSSEERIRQLATRRRKRPARRNNRRKIRRAAGDKSLSTKSFIVLAIVLERLIPGSWTVRCSRWMGSPRRGRPSNTGQMRWSSASNCREVCARSPRASRLAFPTCETARAVLRRVADRSPTVSQVSLRVRKQERGVAVKHDAVRQVPSVELMSTVWATSASGPSEINNVRPRTIFRRSRALCRRPSGGAVAFEVSVMQTESRSRLSLYKKAHLGRSSHVAMYK
jgi:hypothetical protein